MTLSRMNLVWYWVYSVRLLKCDKVILRCQCEWKKKVFISYTFPAWWKNACRNTLFHVMITKWLCNGHWLRLFRFCARFVRMWPILNAFSVPLRAISGHFCRNFFSREIYIMLLRETRWWTFQKYDVTSFGQKHAQKIRLKWLWPDGERIVGNERVKPYWDTCLDCLFTYFCDWMSDWNCNTCKLCAVIYDAIIHRNNSW